MENLQELINTNLARILKTDNSIAISYSKFDPTTGQAIEDMILPLDLEGLLNEKISIQNRIGEIDYIIKEIGTTPIYDGITEIIPASITMRQARLILLQYGLLDTINKIIADMQGEQGDVARITWEYSQTVESANPLFDIITEIARMTLDQKNKMLLEASKL
jgi:hypothetical protein